MKNITSLRIILILILAFFSCVSVEAQQTKNFSEAKGSGKYQASYDFDKWNFSVGKDRYEIRKDGKAKRRNIKNSVVNFRIKIDKDEEIERVIYFAQYKNDLLLIFESRIGDGSGGTIIRLAGKTLKPKWQQNIPAFNVAKGVIENGSAYLAAIGYAAKINLDTGKFIWKHEDFYRKYKDDGAFNIFETPKIEGNVITLTENQDDYKRPPNIIKFNKNSGKVIEVKVN